MAWTDVYFVRFKAFRAFGAVDYVPFEGSLIVRRTKSISTNSDLQAIEQYVARYLEGDVNKVEILALNLLHSLSDI